MIEGFNFLEEYQNVKEQLNLDIIVSSLEVLEKYEIEKVNWRILNEQNGSSFNVLKFLNISETVHSFLVAMLLSPNGEHGQNNLFLVPFLKMLGIEKPEVGKWIVTAEKGRIDILLKRIEPHSVIVIENKSNFAADQENQLYRYWYQEIYYPNRHKPINFSEKNSSKYQIVYLTPDNWKLPSENSLIRPTGYDSSLPLQLPIVPKIIRFRKEIVEWLMEVFEIIPEQNHRLREYVKQYMELWI